MNDSINQFITELSDCLIKPTSSEGKSIKKKEKGSDISISLLDEEKSREKISQFMENILITASPVEILNLVQRSIIRQKECYIASHDGWRAIKKHEDFITIDDFVNFFRGLKIFYELISQRIEIKHQQEKIAIGVLYPAGQDIGKDIIRFAWLSEGYEVIDLGKMIKPAEFIKSILSLKPSILGVSCMLNGCIESLDSLLNEIKTREIDIPIIIGGIAVNPTISYKMAQKYNLPIYYCRDVGEADIVLKQALHGETIQKPEIKEPTKYTSQKEIVQLAQQRGFDLYQIPLENIIIDENARERCASCSEEKKERCPLEIGYETQLSLEESRKFIHRFGWGILVCNPLTENDEQFHCDRENDRRRWLGLIEIESSLKRYYSNTFAFKFPFICPFCSIKECSLKKGFCQMEVYYRPLHETYNINVGATIKENFGDNMGAFNYALILVK